MPSPEPMGAVPAAHRDFPKFDTYGGNTMAAGSLQAVGSNVTIGR